MKNKHNNYESPLLVNRYPLTVKSFNKQQVTGYKLQILPDKYRNISEDLLLTKVKQKLKKLGKKVLLLVHHYQREEIAGLANYLGDSLELAKKSSQHKEAKYIVFCGVYFMAESADILSEDYQIVQLPSLYAGCPMADMADIDSVERAFLLLKNFLPDVKIVPVTYINSYAPLKAFCGRNEGSICTSSNAEKVFKWAYNTGDKIFFFPDEHLGRNTAKNFGIKDEEIFLWERTKEFLTKEEKNKIKKAKVILWNGYCHVHTRFKIEDILKIKKEHPDAKIIVHPECKVELTSLVDFTGSTGQIVKYVKEAPSGSKIVIGTEINLINRLAKENPDKKIFELAYSLCPNMYKINLQNLLWTLDEIGKVNIVQVDKNLKQEAKIALNRMLSLS